MHEYSIAHALLTRIEAEAKKQNALAVHRVKIQLGEHSGVEPSLLRTAYEVLREGTCCAAAVLDIDVLPVRWRCPQCGAQVTQLLECGVCQESAQLVQGAELVLSALELEVPTHV